MNKSTKVVGVLMCIVLGSFTFISCGTETQKEQSATNEIKESKDKVENWTYGEDIDKMDGSKSYFAGNTALNTIDFEFPYNGGSEFQLVVRKEDNANNVILTVDKGQFLASIMGEESLRIKFDEEKPVNFNYDMPADGSSDVIFISNEKQFVKKLKKAKKLKIEALFFNEGYKIIDFDVSGLKWE